MSNEQWGHGWHCGYKAGTQAGFQPCWIIGYDADGLITDVFRALEKSCDGLYLGDRFSLFDFIPGRVYSLDVPLYSVPFEDYDQRDYDNPEYLRRSGLEAASKIYAWPGLVSALLRDKEKRKPQDGT